MKFSFYIFRIRILSASLVLIFAISVYLFLKPFSNVLAPSYDRFVAFCDEDVNTCHETGLPFQDKALSVEARISDLMSRMTISEKIGQMALIEKNSIKDPDDIARYGLGALMSGGGAKPENNTSEGWLELVNGLQGYGRKTRLSIPILYGVDANHGHSNIPGATLFPHSIGLGASRDEDLVRDVAKATAEEVSATGIYWIFSPNLDVVRDTRWGRTYETFGSYPKVVSLLGKAYVEGLQSFEQGNFKVAGGAKHFIGNGATEWGSSINDNFYIDQGNCNLSEDELLKIHLEPFKFAVDAGVKSVMVGLNKWKGEKVAFNKHLLTEVFKEGLGFSGFLVSDWYGIYEKEWDKYDALKKAINAGVDMVMLPYDFDNFSIYMHRALANGDIDESRLNDAVRRILKTKFELGLFDNPIADSAGLKNIGSKEHREIARTAVRKSLVLLKNNNSVPISKKTKKILIAGSAADNIGKQSGGWTVEWQGIDGNWIPGTTILKGIKDMVSSSTAVEYDLNGDFEERIGLADVGIAVVGENPYSEGWGDEAHPELSEADIKAIDNLKKVSKKIVVIIVSGRPLDIKAYAKDWDAIIAAWLPGSEGQGVADALFGDYGFTGTLPVSWEY